MISASQGSLRALWQRYVTHWKAHGKETGHGYNWCGMCANLLRRYRVAEAAGDGR